MSILSTICKTLSRHLLPALLWVSLLLFPALLDAQEKPDIPDLVRVTVMHDSEAVLIEWNASESPGVIYYHLYKMNDQLEFEKIETFTGGELSYLDTGNPAENLSYSVTAEDGEGNESLFDDNIHRAVTLEVDYDLCSQHNVLKWTPYEGWDGQISGYRICGGISGQESEYLHFTDEEETEWVHQNVENDHFYSYYIETINTNQDSSHSAIDSCSSFLPEAPSYLQIDYVTVVDKAQIELQFTADISGEVNSFRVLRKTDSLSPYREVESILNSTQGTMLINDPGITGLKSYQYLVESIYQPEGCSEAITISESNTSNSILLEGVLDGMRVTLRWSAYNNFPLGTKSFVLQKRSPDGEFRDYAIRSSDTYTFSEQIEPQLGEPEPGELKYRVQAIENGDQMVSTSNIETLEIPTNIQVPNAFTPRNPGSSGINHEFKPLMDFGPEKYLLVVVDRGGRKMFETTIPEQGWDGTYNQGNYVREGVYVYYIQYTDHTGIFKTLTGNVTVLY